MSGTQTVSAQTSDTQLEKAAQQQQQQQQQPKAPGINIIDNPETSRQTSPHSQRQDHRPGPRRNASGTSFLGERRQHDPEHHSKIPYFLRMSGSITPRMLVPLLFVAGWSTLVTCISVWVHPLVVDSLLLTVLGFVVGLGISFRTSSAYERYVDGRKYWMQLSQASRDLARHIWIHAKERHEESAEVGKADLLAKITAMNLIVAFAQALKHRLRFEPYANYPDLEPLVTHLDTFAAEASKDRHYEEKQKSYLKGAGEYLGLTFAESNPRKLIKRSTRQLGNLPLEVLTYLSSYHDSLIQNNLLDGTHQGMVAANLASLNEVLAGTERVLNTPLPIAYSIAISQITWVYVIALPFQLFDALGWVTIPGTVVGAYIILGIAAIGREIENPFGFDDNDLPLENFCNQIATEVDVVRSRPKPPRNHGPAEWMAADANRLLFGRSFPAWQSQSVDAIRQGLRLKAEEVVHTAKEKKGWGGKVPQGDP